MTDKQLNRMLQVDNRFITTLGIKPGILLSELLDKENHCIDNSQLDSDWYFFHEKKHIYLRTALTRTMFDSARKKLEEKWILKTKLGKGKKLYFKVDDYEYSKFIFPKSEKVIAKSIIHEELTKEGYFMYNIWLAHRVWINETILLTSLISKRNYFATKWELINDFFFNSISNIKKDTSLTKAQQIIAINNLVKENLIQIEIVDNNTRYFSLNDDKIQEYKESNYEEFLKAESRKSHTPESRKSHTSKILVNKFNKSESRKSHTEESRIWDTQKVDNIMDWKQNILQRESWKYDTNKNYINTTKEKEIKNKNEEKIRSLLYKYFKKENKEDKSQVDRIAKIYSLQRVNEVLTELNKKPKEESKICWFIIWALDNNKFEKFKPKVVKKTPEEIEKEKLEKQRKIEMLEERKLLATWKMNNQEYYDKIYQNIENELVNKKDETIINDKWEISEAKKNTMTRLKTGEYIKNNILKK